MNNQKGFSLIIIIIAVVVVGILGFVGWLIYTNSSTLSPTNGTTSQINSAPKEFPSFLSLYQTAQYIKEERVEDCGEAVSSSCNDKTFNLYTTKYTFRTNESFESVVDWYVQDKSDSGWKLDKDGELRDETGALVFEGSNLDPAKKTGYLSTGQEGTDIYWIEIKKNKELTQIDYYIPTKKEQVLLYNSSGTGGFPPYPNAVFTQMEKKPACKGDEQMFELAVCGSTAYVWKTADDFDQVSSWYKNDSGGSGWVCAGGGGNYDGPRNASGTKGCTKGDLNHLMSLVATANKTEITIYVK